MSRTHICVRSYLNAGGAFEKVARKLVRRITESNNAPGHATPNHVKRFDLARYNVPQGMSGREAIRNRKGVENTNISDVKFCGLFVENHTGGATRDGRHPKS
jgi:hypothetical protein